MPDFSFLAGGIKPVQLPDPMEYATRGMALSQMADTAAMRRLALQQAQEQRANQMALGQTLPDLMPDLPEPVKAAIRANPMAGAGILKAYTERAKADAELGNVRAQMEERQATAREKKIAPISNIAFGLSQKPDLQPEDVSQLMGMIASSGLEKAMPTIPMQAWTNPESTRAALRSIANAAFAVEKQVTTAETGRHNRASETQQAAKDAAQMARWNAETSQGWARVNQEALGTPQEVIVDGRPMLASFNRKGGGWYDSQTGAKINGNVMPKPADSASLREKLAQNNVTLANIDAAIEAINSRKQSLGPKNFAGDTISQWTDPNGVQVRAMVAQIGGQKLHDLSGAAVSASEASRLMPMIPRVTDRADAAVVKLRNMRREIELMQRELAAGRPLAQVINARPSSGPVSAGASGGWGQQITITPLD